jgi:hypothetical protein
MESIHFITAGAVIMGWVLPELLLVFSSRNISFENSINVLTTLGCGLLAYGVCL